jgi:general stress protein 26
MARNFVERASEVISADRLDCVLALLDLDGYPTASTISVSKNEKIKWLTFCTFVDGNKIKRIERSNLASVCFFSSEPMYNITLVGKIEVITDPKVKKEMWYEQLEGQFSGPEDENYCVLKFTTERYNISFDFEVENGKL